MAIKIRPGFLVSLKTQVEGGVKYQRTALNEETLESGAEVSEWNTEKTVEDPEEFDRATEARLKVRSLVSSLCIDTPFGLVCPKENVPALDAAFEEADALLQEFNEGATFCRVRYSTMRGEIAENAAEAVKAVTEEVATLLADMKGALSTGNVRSIRDLASRASTVGKLLEQDSAGKDTLSRAVAAARKIASTIVKKVEKEGENLADILAAANIEPVSVARLSFVEHDEGEEDEDVMPSIAMGRFAGLSERSEIDETVES